MKKQLRFLFVSIAGLISDIAWQIVKEGHEVKYFIEQESERDIADGFVPKTDDWQQEVDWADVIVFDDVLGQGEKAAALRKQGKLVIGGTAYTDRLEDDRSFGQEELKKAGVNIIPYQDFTSFDDAIAFVQENPSRYVFKPSGEAQNVKRLLFVGEEDDGQDVVRVMEAYKRAFSDEIKQFQLQRRVTGVEVAITAFFNGKEFIYPININFEHKKLFPGNIGPSTGEMGCYDDQTEVLTESGWKLFKDLKTDDKICTLNPNTHHIEYHIPDIVVAFSHHKELLHIQNRALDLCVTLDHNMYVCSDYNARKKLDKYEFIKASDLRAQSKIKRTGEWVAPRKETFNLPSVSLGHYEGRQVVYRLSPEITIPMDDWAAFMGIWLADGWETNGNIGIAPKKPETMTKIEALLARLPFAFRRTETGFSARCAQLAAYLRQFGKAPDKFVPDVIKTLSKEQIEIFLDWYCLGDGTKMRAGFRIFYSCSKKLVDDVQELLLKIGRVGIVKTRAPRNSPPSLIDNRPIISRRPQYEVHERVKKADSWIDRRDCKRISYNGVVYCATVQNHIMYVRRNGKPCWCGNTSCFWSPPNKLFNATLKKLESKFAEEGYVGSVDLNCIVNANGIYPLEFTARFGYPTIMIQQEGMITPIGQFFYDLASGNNPKLKVKSGFQIGVRIVVPPFPFDDKETFEAYSKNAAIVFKKPAREEIHIEDVKQLNGQWLIAGTSGVVLVVVGLGATMKQAQASAYGKIKNIAIPNMYYRTDIGDRWYEDSDRLHNWGYLREV